MTRARYGVSLVTIAFALVACAHTGRSPATIARTAPGGLAAPATATAAAETDPASADDGDDESDDVDDESGVSAESEPASPCPENMALVALAAAVSASGAATRVCVDKWEASLVEVLADGSERPWPHWLPVDGHAVRAKSEPNVYPQGYISEVQAEDACEASGKRLCSEGEWKTACMGPARTTFPYGDDRRPGVCHDTGKSAVVAVFGAQAVANSPVAIASRADRSEKRGAKRSKRSKRSGRASGTKAKAAPRPAKASARPASVEASVWTKLNDPALGQVDGALARTGDHGACVNDFGVYDMVGNIHEWVKTDARLPHGTFAGGYYLDTQKNGDGCNYRTTAHAHEYHDYSTGFRCCADARDTR